MWRREKFMGGAELTPREEGGGRRAGHRLCHYLLSICSVCHSECRLRFHSLTSDCFPEAPEERQWAGRVWLASRCSISMVCSPLCRGFEFEFLFWMLEKALISKPDRPVFNLSPTPHRLRPWAIPSLGDASSVSRDNAPGG